MALGQVRPFPLVWMQQIVHLHRTWPSMNGATQWSKSYVSSGGPIGGGGGGGPNGVTPVLKNTIAQISIKTDKTRIWRSKFIIGVCPMPDIYWLRISLTPKFIFFAGRLATFQSKTPIFFKILDTLPGRTRHCPNAGLMLVHRLRHWPNIISALSQRLMRACK